MKRAKKSKTLDLQQRKDFILQQFFGVLASSARTYNNAKKRRKNS
jgi:hypothetical protein